MQYLGGKFRIRKALGKFINKNLKGRDYYEPFVGAAWVLSEVKAENRFASDANPWLITMWKALQEGWVPPDEVSEYLYKWYRDNTPVDDPMTAFIGFGCSFSGKWFGGYARGGPRNFAKNAKSSLCKQIVTVKSAQFSFRSYEELSPRDALIYCDPPYRNTTGYGAIGTFNHDEFWQRVREWSSGNTVLVSEYDAPEDFVCVLELKSRMGLMNSNKEKEIRAEKVFAHESIVGQIKGLTSPTGRYKMASSGGNLEGKKMPTVEEVVDAIFQLRDKKAELNEKLKQVKAAEAKLDAWLLSALGKNGLDKMGVTTSRGKVTIFRKTKTSFSMGDWSSYLDYVREHEAWDLLYRQVPQKAVAEVIENGGEVPGVNVFRETAVGVQSR